MHEKTVSNRFLNESKTIKAKTEYELNEKIKKQKKQWKEKEQLERMKIEAQTKTKHALKAIEDYDSLLIKSLNTSHIIDWDNFYDNTNFDVPEPTLNQFIIQVGVPKEDKLIEFLLSSFRKKREEKQKEAERLFHNAYTEYHYKKNRFLNEQKHKNNEVKVFKDSFERGNKDSIEKYFNQVLDNTTYPNGFKKIIELEYDEKTKNLIIVFSLPHPNSIPDIVEYKFIQTRREIDEKKMKKSEFQEFYDKVLYQIALRTIYECFISDYPNHLDTIVFNGWVHGIDTPTGNDFDSCIISLHVKKEEFMSLNLFKVIPKDCFRNLKGLSAGALHHLAPIRPILELNKEDKRFIEARDILAELNSTPNLAEMDWDDFEHLIRDLFELYSRDFGGEVKVTQRSREGGIDAVIFDPDPIRGGKYIIQAKRYNDIVHPSAVRELNGVMIDEGAARGILVTTSYFGKDSIDFVKNKPITLIDGPRLVFMLNEHGHKVRCEIKKGKKETS